MSDLQMQKDELLALPVSVDLTTAGRAFGLGRTRAYELARTGQFPCRVIPVGRKFRVPRSALLEALGIEDSAAGPQPAALCPGPAFSEERHLAAVLPQVPLLRRRRSPDGV
jgi:hypothetical protein